MPAENNCSVSDGFKRSDTTAAASRCLRSKKSVSTLSRLEGGQRKPTLELLLPLARAHQVPLDELVGAPETGDPRVHLRPRHGDGGVTAVPLTRRPGGIQAIKLVYPPRTPSGEPELQRDPRAVGRPAPG